jgi:hypothetical protein
MIKINKKYIKRIQIKKNFRYKKILMIRFYNQKIKNFKNKSFKNLN